MSDSLDTVKQAQITSILSEPQHDPNVVPFTKNLSDMLEHTSAQAQQCTRALGLDSWSYMPTPNDLEKLKEEHKDLVDRLGELESRTPGVVHGVTSVFRTDASLEDLTQHVMEQHINPIDERLLQLEAQTGQHDPSLVTRVAGLESQADGLVTDVAPKASLESNRTSVKQAYTH
jgi:hypothetical protein